MHHRLAANMVIVIEHNDERLLDRVHYFIYQQIDRALGKLGQLASGFLDILKKSGAKFRREIANAECEIAEEYSRVGVGVVKLVPDGRPRLSANKLGNKRRLAAARISRDHCDRRTQVAAQHLKQARSLQYLRQRAWRKKFGP